MLSKFAKTRVSTNAQRILATQGSIMNGHSTMRNKSGSAMDMTALQMNNKMFVSKSILDKQIEIMKSSDVPTQLKLSDEYVYRHMGNSDKSTNKMLEYLEVDSIDQLMEQVVPESIRLSPEARFKHNGKELDGIDSETLMLERVR